MNMNEQETEMNDPALKKAIRRAWGTECCPTQLRRDVHALFDEAEQPIRLWLPWAAAAAAVLVMAITISAVHRPFSPTASDLAFSQLTSQNLQLTDVLPAALKTQLITTHDRCAA